MYADRAQERFAAAQRQISELKAGNAQLQKELQAARASEAETMEVAKEMDDEGMTRVAMLEIELRTARAHLAQVRTALEYNSCM